MYSTLHSVSSKTSSSPKQPTLDFSDAKFGKTAYITIAVIITVAIIIAALIIPQGSAIIPLNVNYAVGEKMVYDTTMTGAFQIHNSTLSSEIMGLVPSNMSLDLQQTIEVIDFDGNYYTLNRTSTMMLNAKPYSFSMREKINKTGYSIYLLNLGNITQEVPNTGITSNSYLTQLLNKPEVKVGDTIHVPYPSVSSGMEITGDLTVTFGGLEDLTVRAGTYKVFRIDITSNNLRINYNIPASNSNINVPTNINMNLDINYQIYMEYGTLRQIKSTIQQTATYQSAMMNATMHISTDMALNQHIKP